MPKNQQFCQWTEGIMLSNIDDSLLTSREEPDFKECATEDKYMTEKKPEIFL